MAMGFAVGTSSAGNADGFAEIAELLKTAKFYPQFAWKQYLRHICRFFDCIDADGNPIWEFVKLGGEVQDGLGLVIKEKKTKSGIGYEVRVALKQPVQDEETGEWTVDYFYGEDGKPVTAPVSEVCKDIILNEIGNPGERHGLGDYTKFVATNAAAAARATGQLALCVPDGYRGDGSIVLTDGNGAMLGKVDASDLIPSDDDGE